MALRCNGSKTDRWAKGEPRPDPTLPHNEQVFWSYHTGECWDCGGRFPLHWREGLVAPEQVLDAHEPYVATTVREALSATPSPQTQAAHLEAIRKAAKPS